MNVNVHVLMRDEKEERSKVKQTTRQHVQVKNTYPVCE